MKTTPLPTLKQLFAKTEVSASGCWLWTGSKLDLFGYGKVVRITKGKVKRYPAHKLVYALHVGIDVHTIPRGTVIRHSCHTPACINPKHLSPGTQTDNMQDAKRAGRLAYGSLKANAILTEEAVLEILRLIAEGKIQKQVIAKQFGVAPSTISNILSGRIWKFLTNKTKGTKHGNAR